MIKIWTLNQAGLLLKDESIQKKIINIIQNKTGKKAEFADRNPYNAKGIRSKIKHNLMYEEDFEYSEYFIPTVIKCLGNLLSDNKLISGPLKPIIDFNIAHNVKEYKYFWDTGYTGNDPNLVYNAKMATKPYSGYYEILQKEARDGNKNILIGYSQGGFTAKFLAWIDEYVFNNQCIHTIITIGSPNFGSPLSNQYNRKNVTKIINKALNGLAVLINPDSGSILEFKSFDDIHIFFKKLIDIADYFFTDGVEANLRSYQKWLGGLSMDANNAFFDLDINLFQESGSALSLSNSKLNKIYHGSVITANNSIFKLIKGFIPLGILDFIFSIYSFFSGLLKRFKKGSEEYAKIFHEQNYKKPGIPDILNRKQFYYRTGKSRNNLPRLKTRSHDFLIPSAYQVMQEDSEVFLGNYINYKGDHNSGRSLKERGGIKNIYYIKKLLKKIKS